MPRKKYKRNQKLKQTKIIQIRLMEISLKMDNYIYKNRPISLSEAQMYYQEVPSYKTQCGDNARILQVIDKLKHQLKALIEENQGSADYYNVQEVIENSMTVCPLSPTYSVHSEVIEAPAYEEQLEIDNNITINLPSNTIDKIDQCSEEDIDHINFKEKEIPKNKSGSNIKDIEISLSNLTVNEEDATKTQNVASIIDNVIPKFTIQDTKGQISNDIMKTVDTHTQKPLNSEVGTHNRIDKCKTKVAGANFTPITNNLPSQDINKTAASNKIEGEIKGNKVTRRKRSSNSKTKDNASKPKEVPKPKKPRKQKTCTPQVTTNMADNSYTESIPPLVTAFNYKLTNPKLLLKSSESKCHPIKSVYNINVVNDLSWVENIRYIREVASDEIDPKLTYLDDSFWQTLELPTNWNDQDFLY